MAVINQGGFPTLLDIAKMTDPQGRIAKIAEVLTIDSPLIGDMPWVEANGPDGHLLTIRNALPGLAWRKFNQGVVPSKGSTGQFTETCGMLDGISKVDKRLAERNGNAAEFRSKQDMAFVASYKRTLETAFFYSSTKTNPEQIMGLAPRLDALTGIPYASQVIKHTAVPDGVNDQSSIWLVGWAPDKVYGIYPKGSKVGLDMQDMGEELESDGAGGQFRAYRSYFSWNVGLAVEDARYLVRIANIDNTQLVGTGNTLIDKMTDALEQIQSLEGCKPVFYMNRKIRAFLRKQINATTASQLTFETVAGKQVLHFGEVPIHRTDALLNTEATI
jgi:hypothetical protein